MGLRAAWSEHNRRRLENERREAERDQVDVEQHEATIEATRAGTRAAVVVGVLAMVVGVITALGTTWLGRDQGSDPGEFVVVSGRSGLSFATPRPVEELGTPPEFSLEGDPSEHCGVWLQWFETVDVVTAGFPAAIDVQAPAQADIAISKIDIEVTDFKPLTADSTEVRCFYGGEGIEATIADIELTPDSSTDGSFTVREVNADLEDEVPIEVPPGKFHVDAGGTETLLIQPHGQPGFYEWTMTVTATVDQETVSRVLGKDQPLRAWVPDVTEMVQPHSVDWDVVTCTWSDTVRYVPGAEPPTQEWTC